ncbi:seryl-tRNA synthetase [Testicularia cyperi]|uniref:serine--tRNA ligase n=1 Tax=Testicularia cyperi TaxID=1882483 RepID=A0A317XJ26_9BASI|nr:seryl-tRNA synthetase [Testicularia cyperi]
MALRGTAWLLPRRSLQPASTGSHHLRQPSYALRSVGPSNGQMSVRHASQSRPAQQNKDKPSSSKHDKAFSSSAAANDAAKANASAAGGKPRTLPPPISGRGLAIEFLNEAIQDMKLRKMPYPESDFKTLFESRGKLPALSSERHSLHTEQAQLSRELSHLFTKKSKLSNQRALALAKKEKELSAKSSAKADKQTKKDGEPAASTPALSKEDLAVDAAIAKELEALQTEIDAMRAKAKAVKQKLEAVQKEEDQIRTHSANFRLSWPNRCHPDVPVGPEQNAVVVSVKDPLNILPREFNTMKEPWNRSVLQAKDFPAGPRADATRDHLTLAATANQAEVDMKSGLLATGSSWPYLLGSLSLLEHALSQYALSTVVRRGFMAVSPPDVVRTELADRCGFRPRDEKAKQTYFLESTSSASSSSKGKGAATDTDSSADLCLAATAEIPLAGLLAARTFDPARSKKAGAAQVAGGSLIQQSELPIKLAALGHAFRAEAGARGADTRGLYRVHQFTKVEMFVATDRTSSASDAMLEELRSVQEEVISGLGLPYRVLDMPTEELGASAYRKYDIEVWMPGRGSWGEVSSASNCTDYQALRLGIRLSKASVKNSSNSNSDSSSSSSGNGDDRNPAVHTLNATAAAIPRLIVAILENHGVRDGKLVLPDALKPFWLAGEADSNVVWLPTSKPRTRLQKAMQQVQSIAQRNGTDPATMVASFLILHELTALVPLALLFYVFGALGVGVTISQWLLGSGDGQAADADSGLASRFRAWARNKEERFERYCRRKGYLGFEKQDAETIAREGKLGQSNHLAGAFANMVAAYIVVKALLPVRIGMSMALAGRFSRAVLEPAKRATRKIFASAPTKATTAPSA